MTFIQQVAFAVVHRDALTDQQHQEILALCFQAWGADFAQLWSTFSDSTHILAVLNGRVISHAMWVTRWLQPAGMAPLRTAYVEAVVTDAAYQGHGLATAVLQRLHASILDFDLGGLAPARYGLYERLGWQLWRGPLSVRTPTGLSATPDEEVMVLWLPRTPALDLDAPLSVEWREGELW